MQDGATRTLHGREDNTTNNRMEILAVIKGVEALPARVDVRVHSDSKYVINTMTKGWKRNANKGPVGQTRCRGGQAQRAVELGQGAHAGHPLNEEADRIANAEARGEPVDAPSPARPKPQLSHVDASGKAQMVDVGPKAETERVAVVTGAVLMRPETLKLIESNAVEKGDVPRRGANRGASWRPRTRPNSFPSAIPCRWIRSRSSSASTTNRAPWTFARRPGRPPRRAWRWKP